MTMTTANMLGIGMLLLGIINVTSTVFMISYKRTIDKIYDKLDTKTNESQCLERRAGHDTAHDKFEKKVEGDVDRLGSMVRGEKV